MVIAAVEGMRTVLVPDLAVTGGTGIAVASADCAVTVSEGTGREETDEEVKVEAGVCSIAA